MRERDVVRRILKIAKIYKWAFLLSYTILLAELLFNQLLPIFLSKVINSAVYESDMSRFLLSTLYYAFVFVGFASCGFMQLQLWQRIHNKYIYDIRIVCYKKILRLKPCKLTDIKSGDLIKTINDDVTEFHHIIQRFAMRVVNAGIGTIVSLIIVCMMRWEIALFMIFIIPISAVLSKRIKEKLKKESEYVRQLQGQYASWVMEVLNNIRELKLFVAEKSVLRNFVKKNSDIVRATTKYNYTVFKATELINGIYFLGDIFFYIVCTFFVVNHTINIGEYVAIASYFTMVTRNIKRVLYGNVDYQRRKTCIERVFRLLDEEEENENGLSELSITEGKIEINNMSFSYDSKIKVLNNINMQIMPGEKVGIVGQSGVGKSTIANLLLKIFEPQEGEILIDGQNLSDCKISSIRSSIGIVSQENIVFNTTVRDNITFGASADDEILWDILEKICLKDKIKELPQGLDTILSEEKIALSGGERQRLCIARLFFRNPKIIVLDEATSALDKETEKNVQEALNILMMGKTAVVISHRARALIDVDKIFVLHDGVQVACGCYEKLIDENEVFRNLFAN